MPGFRVKKNSRLAKNLKGRKDPGLPGPAMAGKVSRFGEAALRRLAEGLRKKKKFPTVSEKILRKVVNKENLRKEISVPPKPGFFETPLIERNLGFIEKRSGLEQLLRKTAGPQKDTPIQRAKKMKKLMEE